MSPEESPLFVQSLASGISVLNVFNGERQMMSLPEIAAAAGITKSAAQRFAFTLEAVGLPAEAASVRRTGSTPSSGLTPGSTRAPRLAASSCAPRQTPQ